MKIVQLVLLSALTWFVVACGEQSTQTATDELSVSNEIMLDSYEVLSDILDFQDIEDNNSADTTTTKNNRTLTSSNGDVYSILNDIKNYRDGVYTSTQKIYAINIINSGKVKKGSGFDLAYYTKYDSSSEKIKMYGMFYFYEQYKTLPKNLVILFNATYTIQGKFESLGSPLILTKVIDAQKISFNLEKEFDTFVSNNIGKSIDMDNAYGAQCVDLMHAYIKDVLGIPRESHDIRGNAYPIFEDIINGKTISYGTRKVKFEKIYNTITGVPQKGDIVFFYNEDGIGHVSLFIEGDDNSFVSLDQNWYNANSTVGSPAAKVTHKYTGSYPVAGWLHPVIISE